MTDLQEGDEVPDRLAVQREGHQRIADLFSRPLHKVVMARYSGIPPKHARDARAIGAATEYLKGKVVEVLNP